MSGNQLLDVRAHGRGPPAIEAFFQNAMPVGVVSCSGTPTRPIAPPGRAIASAVSTACSRPTHSSTECAPCSRQLPDALDRFLATLAHDVCGAELLPERRPLRVAAEQDDPLGAEALRRDHTAEPDGAVADDGDGLAGTDLRGDGGVVTGAHHVGEREQRRHERIVRADRQHDQRAVRLRDAHRFALAAVDIIASRTCRRGDIRSAGLPGRRRRFRPTRETAKPPDRRP